MKRAKMSEYFAKVNWVIKNTENYIDNKYSRGHQWIFDGGITVELAYVVLFIHCR